MNAPPGFHSPHRIAMFTVQAPPEKPWQRQHLRVPREDGTVFARPALSDVPESVRRNARLLADSHIAVQGRSLSQLRDWTRDELLAGALQYTAEIAGPGFSFPENSGSDETAFVVDGHQPSLFHPGVWVKNFALADIARRTGRIPLHFIVDNDTLTTSSLAVPAGTRQSPRILHVPFDAERPTVPWEEAKVLDGALFHSFADRVSRVMNDWPIQPLLPDIWPAAVEMVRKTGSLRDAFTAARHRLECAWGVQNLELPLSRLETLDPFLWFAAHLLAQAGRFREIHNRVLAEFRRINRVRSRTHPVPELSRDEGWTETPFWIWRAGESRRRPAFVRTRDRETELTDRGEILLRFPLREEGDACCAVEVLRELQQQGIRFRTRALTTTLFARLCVSDLFIHGIGGAKYDEMTDRIISRFFGLPAPEFLTLSATVHLPLATPFPVSAETRRGLQHRLRDLHYNPDRYLPRGKNPAIDRLIDEKLRLIAEQNEAQSLRLSHRERRARTAVNHRRFLRFREIDERLEQFVEPQKLAAQEELAAVRQQLAANAVLQNREFSFALYPEEKLRPFLTGLWNRAVTNRPGEAD